MAFPGYQAIVNSWGGLIGRLSTRHRIGLFSVGWSTAAQFVGLAIRLASNLILTRLLAPEIYGILGSAMAVLTTLEWLSDVGVQPALVRHPKGNRPEYLITGWWKDSASFGRDDLPLVAKVADQAHSYIFARYDA